MTALITSIRTEAKSGRNSVSLVFFDLFTQNLNVYLSVFLKLDTLIHALSCHSTLLSHDAALFQQTNKTLQLNQKQFSKPDIKLRFYRSDVSPEIDSLFCETICGGFHQIYRAKELEDTFLLV